MSIVNIAKGYRQFSKEELLNYLDMGILECNGFELTEFINYIMSDMPTPEELEKEKEVSYDAGYEEGYWDGRASLED